MIDNNKDKNLKVKIDHIILKTILQYTFLGFACKKMRY